MCKFNSGLDILFVQLGLSNDLATFRFLKTKYFNKDVPNKIYLSETYVQKRDLIKLKKLALKYNLVHFRGKNFIEFANESEYLKRSLGFKNNLIPSRNALSITQKAFLYSVSQEYKLDNKNYRPQTLSEWRGHSWTIIALSVLENTSQAKIATYLGRKRETVNRKLKHEAFNLYVGNNFLEVSESLLGKGMDIKSLRNLLNRNNLKGYKLNHEGKLVRQLPNSYKLKSNCLINFIHKPTFFYSNKKLNESFQGNLEDSQNCTKKSTRLPRVKLISLLRLKGRSNASAKIFGKDSDLAQSAKDLNRRIISERGFTFITPKSKKEIQYTKVCFTNFPSKWSKEFYRLKISGVKLNENIFFNAFNTKSLNSTQKRPAFVLRGKNFKTATCKGFHKNQRVLNEYEAIKTPDLTFQYMHLKKMQREYFEFMGISLFKNSQETGVQGIMCNVA